MKRFLQKLLLIIVGLAVLFYIDAYFPVVLPLCLLISALAVPFLAMNDDWTANTLLVGISFWVAFFIYLYVGYHVKSCGEDRVALVTPFYPIGKVVAVGEKVDTLYHVPESFISDEGELSAQFTDVYVLHLDSNSSLLFSNHRVILQRGRHLRFEPRYFKYDWILTVSYLDDYNIRHVIDLLGHDISTPGYFPDIKTIPATPDIY